MASRLKPQNTTSTSYSQSSLLTKLASALPKSANFKIYHLSTPPTKTSSLYSAPPDGRPDRTYCESHFLTASIRPEKGEEDVLVFAIEILIYSTSHDTTFFVSKADSTGFLHLLRLPKGTPSPIRTISATFLQHLLDEHRRPGIRNVVSLFARAQDQYLFPGSVEYSGKHVLDDRGLVRWWCRVLDPLIEEPKEDAEWDSIKGYLIVPGLDTHETSSYTPRIPGTLSKKWTVGHPLQKISKHVKDVPPRCLIPHYPDDPKARFLDELDDEITKGKTSGSGQWKSVKSIDQFWEMMAFRQECSAGRLVGFIWVVFEPKTQEPDLPSESLLTDSQNSFISDEWDNDSSLPGIPHHPNLTSSQITSFSASSQPIPTNSPAKSKIAPTSNPSLPTQDPSSKPKKKPKLTGPIISRAPRIKTQQTFSHSGIPESTPYYFWRPSGRGQVIVEESDYKRITELLLRLDFANLELASSSTARWVNEVSSGASKAESEAWGSNVTGSKETAVKIDAGSGRVNTLNVGLVKKKRKSIDEGTTAPQTAPGSENAGTAPAVNMLNAGMIRKKPKIVEAPIPTPVATPVVNVLGAGMVRKKPKV